MSTIRLVVQQIPSYSLATTSCSQCQTKSFQPSLKYKAHPTNSTKSNKEKANVILDLTKLQSQLELSLAQLSPSLFLRFVQLNKFPKEPVHSLFKSPKKSSHTFFDLLPPLLAVEHIGLYVKILVSETIRLKFSCQIKLELKKIQ